MNTNRLSKTIEAILNDQMTREAYASQVYLALGSWAESQGYSGISNFLFRHAQEERNHMMKILEYILKRGGEVKVVTIPGPPEHPTSMNNCFEKVFEHEVDNTNSIYKVVQMSLEEKDWATWNFMQWFVKEQTEEETLAMDLLNKLKIAGGEKVNSNTLYSLDRDLETTPDDATLAQDVTAVNP